MTAANLQDPLRKIRFLAMDVDGVLTRGDVTWGVDASGAVFELKSFNVRDGLGFGLVHSVGLRCAWITGRSSAIVLKRAAELGVTEVVQGARDKRRALEELAARLGFRREEILYIGDDLNDLPAFEAAGVRVAPADASAAVRDRADWVTEAAGGCGAVREVMDELLRVQGRWEEAVTEFLQRLRTEQSASSG